MKKTKQNHRSSDSVNYSCMDSQNGVIVASKDKKKDVSVELIRILACLIVVAIHTNELPIASGDKTTVFWRILFSDGVTIFFIMMGFFLFKAKSFKHLLKRTFSRIVLPAIAVMVVAEVFWAPICHEGFQNMRLDIEYFMKRILSLSPTDRCAHLWYIFIYCKIVVMFPILKAISENEKANKYFLIIMLFTMFYNNMYHYFKPEYGANLSLFIETTLLYPLLGNEIYKRREQIKGNRKIRIISFILLILVEAIRYIMQYNIWKTDITSNYFVGYDNIFACLCATLLMIAILSIDIKKEKIGDIINYLGQRTFVIYLIHLLVIMHINTTNFRTVLQGKLGYTEETLGEMSFLQEGIYLFVRIVIEFALSLVIASALNYLKLLMIKLIDKIKTKKLSKASEI